MRYKANCVGYELGNFLIPKYPGAEKSRVFFLLLQNTEPDTTAESFSVRLGKTRYLNGGFYSDCLKVLLYLAVDGGQFSIYDITLKSKKDGTRYFDAISFLNEREISYEENNTEHYRYFKSRINRDRKELIISDSKEFSVIHRRINADDYESLSVFYNRSVNNVLKQGYFLLEYASDFVTSYRLINYFQSEKELLEHIKAEYSGTIAECVTTYSISELVAGKEYTFGHQQGTHKSTAHIILVHHENLQTLYHFLDLTEIESEQGEPIKFSEWIKSAETVDEISEVISVFNESQENYW